MEESLKLLRIVPWALKPGIEFSGGGGVPASGRE